MAITKIQTGSLPATESKGGSNALLWILGIGTVLAGAYYFLIYKPEQEEKAKKQ